jgi:signal transduction histidine kinase
MAAIVATVRTRLSDLAAGGLVQQARRASLVFVFLTLLVGAAEIAVATGLAGGRQLLAGALLSIWAAWSVWAHRHPEGSRLADVIAVATLLGVGVSLSSAGVVLAPALVTIYQRTLIATVRQALTTGLAMFMVFGISRTYGQGGGWWLTLEMPAFLLAFVVIALVLQALGSAASAHERGAQWERILTDVSAELLRTHTIGHCHRVAVEGAHRLVAQPDATVGLWLVEGDDLQLVARAGPDAFATDRVRIAAMPTGTREGFFTGLPHLLDQDTVLATEAAIGHPHHFAEALVAPLAAGDEITGGLVVAAPSPLAPELTDVLGRFANEVSMAEQRARLVDELEQTNAELERSHEIKNQFLSMVSHELRTPLTSICGFATTLLTHWASIPDDKRREYVGIVARQGEHQHRLVDDLLTTSRIMSGRLSVRPAMVDMRTAVTAAVEEIGLPRDEIDVLIGHGARAWADPMHVHQILTNLLSNARKYGAPPYGVTVSPDTQAVRVGVHDHGPGVPESFRAHLFEPFRQADTGDRRSDHGVGLGLAIVRELALANHGAVVYDDGTEGASFLVTLPLTTRAPLEAEAERLSTT